MILRSIGTTYQGDTEKLTSFKKNLFKKLDHLIRLMDAGMLKNEQIRSEIYSLARSNKITIGQSQKAINVVLKYHYILNHYEEEVGKELDCPLDSVILKAMNQKRITLTDIKKEKDYEDYQAKIEKICSCNSFRIDYDYIWDKQNLEKDGLI